MERIIQFATYQSEIKMETIKKFKEFIGSISKSDKVVLIYDRDGDGVSATVLAKFALAKKGINSEAIPSERANPKNLIGELHHLKPNFVIFFDISAEGFQELFDEFPRTKFMVIDHHKKYTSPKKVLVIKPGDIGYKKDPANYPTAKLSYDLFSEVTNISEFRWIACVGVISDSSYQQWKSFVYSVLKAKGWESPDIFESVPGRIASIINFSNSIYESRIHEAMELMLSGKPDKILKSDLAKFSLVVRKEADKKVEEHKKKAEFLFDGKLIFYEIKSEYKIAGTISNLVSRLYPNSLLLVLERSRGMMKISSRSMGSGIPANDILVKSTKGLEGANAGGHAPAAGAIMREEDFPKFKKRLISEVKRLIN